VSSHQSEWPGDSSEAGREGGREFQALGPDAQKDRSPTVFNLKVNGSRGEATVFACLDENTLG